MFHNKLFVLITPVISCSKVYNAYFENFNNYNTAEITDSMMQNRGTKLS